MSEHANGELVPVGGGDPMPLVRTEMTVGRRESCDIHLDFPNVSGIHCELVFRDGYWSIRDLNSTNGIKVNDLRVISRPLKPGDILTIGKRRYSLNYQLSPSAQQELEALLAEDEDIMGQSLLEKAGLENPNAGKLRSVQPPRRHMPGRGPGKW
ncbi:MAG TPA: FHA domain-containing protein [Gemmataceae bacterium]|jgi:pSer/pThr/pTyr-binding forkhead associated (FHA) protein|nr:FHA domain-containing protein [Gemmataceae bacterium]